VAVSDERWQLLNTLFSEAVTLDADERAAFIARYCANDPDLEAELSSMLAADDSNTAFSAVVVDAAASAYSPSTFAGASLGPYRLIREIGQGGMGTVWLAERDDDVYRGKVAIKLIHGLSGSAIRARFAAERQILSSLNHPGIARLLDGGRTPDGQLFVVIEFVDGLSIDRYCDTHRLDLNARLQLFVDVCRAVQHAHKNLVVHRDIKPANILVTNEGVAKLIDFGIAKPMGAEVAAGSNAPMTKHGEAPMTPRYASPEQVRGDNVATTSDVYSLGVLLFHLLTGASPYGDTSDAPAVIAKAICETPPSAPSGLVPELRGDLETIILKALRKEPDARYASVDDFADDVERHLQRLPVHARPATVYYRASRFVSRHPFGVIAGTLAIAGLLGLTAFSTYQMREAVRANEIATRERAIAVSEVLRATLSAAQQAIAEKDTLAVSRLLDSVAPRDRGWEWSLLRHQVDETLLALQVPDTIAIGMQSEDLTLVTLSRSGQIRWWQDGKPVAVATVPVERLEGAHFADNGLRLLTVSDASRVALWDIGAQAQPVKVSAIEVDDVPVASALSPGGDHVTVATNESVVVWRESDGKSISLPTPDIPIDVQFSADGASLGVLFQGNKALGYQIVDTNGRIVVSAPAGEVHALALSPDGQSAITSDGDNVLRLREASSTRVLERFVGHSQPPGSLQFSRNGHWLASGGKDATLRVWPVAGDGHRRTYMMPEQPLTDLQLSADGRHVAALGGNKNVLLWDTTEVDAASVLSGTWSVFTNNGAELVTLDRFGAMRFHDTASLESFDRVQVGSIFATAMAVAPSGEFIASGEAGQVVIVNAAQGDQQTTIQLDDSVSDVVSIAISPAGDRLLTLQASGTLSLIDLPGGDIVATSQAQAIRYGSVVFSADGDQALATVNGRLILIDTVALETKAEYASSDASSLSAALGPDGDLIASGWTDGKVRLLEAHGLTEVASIDAHTDAVTALAWSPDGSRIVSGGQNASVRISSVTTARTVLAIDPPTISAVRSISFSPGGGLLVAGLENRGTYTWRAAPARERWAARDTLARHRAAVQTRVASLMAASTDTGEVARRLRADERLPAAQRRAALQLAMVPRLPPGTNSSEFEFGQALRFADDDAHVLATNDEGLRMRSTFTLEAWINPAPFPDSHTPLSLRMIVNKEGEYQIAIRKDGELLWTIAGPNGWLGWTPTYYRAPIDKWTHVALVRDGPVVRFFVNGRRVQEQAVPESIGDHHTGKNEFRIGGRQHTPSSFSGLIAEVRVWATVRNATELRASMYNRVAAGSPGLLAAWSFDEGAGETAADLTGNHTGLLRGAQWLAD